MNLLRTKYPNFALPILRLAAGGVLTYEGSLKIFVQDRSALVAYFGGLGFPAPEFVASFISFFEFFVGLFIILGVFTRISAFFAAGEMAVATLAANLSGGITSATEVTILLFTIFLALFFAGGGKFSFMKFLKQCNCPNIFLVFLIGISFAIFLSLSVFAAGGGGGGGGGGSGGGGGAPLPPPPCEADTWTCANWSECAIGGTQARTCTLTNDCPTAETPKPSESQYCTPPVVESKPVESPVLQVPPAPKVPQVPVEACIKDEYQCGDWSQCQPDGRQNRSCNLVKDCPGVSAKKPEQSRVCPGLRCGHLATLQDRISCRLGLTQKELAQEFAVLYAPEYCKTEETKEERNKCIRLYQELGPCWKLPPGSTRVQCAKDVIGISGVALKEQIKNLIIFRMYELEVHAEILMSDWGAPKDEVVALETFIETKKQEIEKTEDTKEWKKIIQETKVRWRKFINDIKPYIKNASK